MSSQAGKSKSYNSCNQAGFTLVELMVSLVVGLLIVFGAGQIYFSGFKSFRKVEEMSDRQAVVLYVAESIIKDIRKADMGKRCKDSSGNDVDILREDGKSLNLMINDAEDGNGEVCLSYDIREVDGKYVIYLRRESGSNPRWEPIAEGFDSGTRFFEEPTEGLYKIRLGFKCDSNSIGQCSPIVFYAMNRTVAVTE